MITPEQWNTLVRTARNRSAADVADFVLQLAAAPAQRPDWPSNETMGLLEHVCDIYGNADRERVRDALLADPIIKAAIALRNAEAMGSRRGEEQDVMDAVQGAGL